MKREIPERNGKVKLMGAEGSRRAAGDSRGAVDGSRRAADDSRGAVDGSRGAVDDPRRAVDASRKAKNGYFISLKFSYMAYFE